MHIVLVLESQDFIEDEYDDEGSATVPTIF